MSDISVGTSLAAFGQKVAAGNTAKSSGVTPAVTVSSAVQEATESEATTIKEAQSGDRAAIRKLQQQQAKEKQQQKAAKVKASEPGKGQSLDHDA